jgi:hypothetical protein
MKVLVCGGRDYVDVKRLQVVMDYLHELNDFDHLIHGAAIGADTLAGKWAKDHGVHVMSYEANWELHGNSAGPIRNTRMLVEGKPDLVVAFPGGKGTSNMMKQAINKGFDVFKVFQEGYDSDKGILVCYVTGVKESSFFRVPSFRIPDVKTPH